jgi:ElaB/YqjD/DUF883 family membrane-anchored ribosome-binding protein
MRNGSALNSSINDLRKDLHAVARDAEHLLKATAGVAGDRIQEARSQTEATLRHVLDNLNDRHLRKRVRKLARTTDNYVHDHSWGLIGVAAGVGLLIGLLSRRR